MRERNSFLFFIYNKTVKFIQDYFEQKTKVCIKAFILFKLDILILLIFKNKLCFLFKMNFYFEFAPKSYFIILFFFGFLLFLMVIIMRVFYFFL
jgi:hypothetical protein